jgi:two-component system response regulator AtoC
MPDSAARTILVGEDELEVRGYLQMALKCLGFSAEMAQDGDEVLSFLRSSRAGVAAVLLDVVMPNRDGMQALRAIRDFDPDLPVIMISGASSTVDIVSAMKAGATDFLTKPLGHDQLRNAISRALERNGDSLPAPPASPNASYYFAGSSRMRDVYVVLAQVGSSEAPVLIQGETGTGKEVIARELNSRSPRAHKPFLKLNCAALPSELVESELFGYERGAFTGALQRKTGMFENADGGTVLLDEIGDMDFRLQAKLLQVLQDGSFQRIGGRDMITVNVRVMAATHRDLEKCIQEHTFREDLYYRLNVVNIHLPPLRERLEEIAGLAEFLLQKHTPKNETPPRITQELRDALLQYSWPGNVRELENHMRKFLIFRAPDRLAAELKLKATRRVMVSAAHGRPPEAAQRLDAVENGPVLEQVVRAKERAEADVILAALNSTRWNRKRAAALLKTDYKALLYRMKKLGIEAAGDDDSPSISREVN